ncbi:MAG: hypothetical protein Q8N96_02130 [Methylovulum sp.]|nr:hypothetical protein [Methylovulum sp.]
MTRQEAAEARQAAIDAENRAKLNDEINALAANETSTTAKRITTVRPLANDFVPKVEGLRTADFAGHLHFNLEQSGVAAKRNELTEIVKKTTDSIQRIDAENAELAAARRDGLAGVDVAGKVGMNLLDIETLSGIKERTELELAELPDSHRDWHGESWDKSVKEARKMALFSAIEACESVITEVLRNLRSTNDVTPNYSRTVKVPWG